MLNFAIVFSAALLTAGANCLSTSRDSTQPSTLRTNDTAAAYDAVDRTYEELLAKPLPERNQLFMQLPSSMKSRVWSHHLLIALAQHPEFTDAQRAVINYGLSVMTPQLFDVDPSSAQWKSLVDEPLRELTKQAKAAFPLNVARELFLQLGPEPPRSHVDRVPPGDSVSLRHDSDTPRDARRAYDELLSKTVTERKSTFAQMSCPMKSSVWTRHLLTTLAEHPELTTTQREVIQYALSILRPQLFEIGPSDMRWKDLVDQPLRQLKTRALAAFPPALARELFFQMGPDQPRPETTTAPSSTGSGSFVGLKVSPLDVIGGPCTCTAVSDWCDTSGLGVSSCVHGACFTSEHGCGTLWVYGCYGKCKSIPI